MPRDTHFENTKWIISPETLEDFQERALGMSVDKCSWSTFCIK